MTILSDSKTLLTIAESATYLGVSRSFLYQTLIGTGTLVPLRLSSKVVRFPRRALDDYIDSITPPNDASTRRSTPSLESER